MRETATAKNERIRTIQNQLRDVERLITEARRERDAGKLARLTTTKRRLQAEQRNLTGNREWIDF